MRHRRGFTLLELLVVTSIIVVLMSLLLPALARVREQAHMTTTKAQIVSLSTVMQAYHGDFNAFPGIVPNGQLGVAGAGPAGCGITVTSLPNLDRMSMAENVYLSLLGGLEPVTPATNPPTFQYTPAKAGNGPMWLGVTPKKLPKYADNVDVSKGLYTDNNDTAAMDTAIPEFVDKFPEAMPFLILRARTGAPGVASVSNVSGAAGPAQQYDLEQVNSYTVSEIGVGRKLNESDVRGHTPPSPFKPFHGFRTALPNASIGAPPTPPGPEGPLVQYYPYDLCGALIDPGATRVLSTATAPANQPRQKDGFIIISAGIDRVYGTSDDITNFDRF